MLAQNYHLNISFVEGTTAQSGVAIKLRNQELTDERVSDIIRWKQTEKDIFEIESVMLGVEANINAGTLDKVDYQENVEILSDEEQRARWDWDLSHGLIDEKDILTQRDKDRFPDRETAQAYLDERKAPVEQEETTTEGTLLQALTTPVE